MAHHLKFTNDATGETYEVLMVHNPAHEGSLMVDRRTGAIVTPIVDRPEWAGGLAVALLAEHREFYQKRTGTYQGPTLFDLSDLGWIGVDAEGDEVEVFADVATRQERLTGLLRAAPETGGIAGVLAGIEMSFENVRTEGEASAIEKAQDEGFEEVRKEA